MKNSKNKKSNGYPAKKLAICAMLSALGVIFLGAGSLLDVLDLSMAVLASMLCMVAVAEYGGSAPWMIYGVTSILGLILLPVKTPAAFYALFFGFYPIIKARLEKLPRAISWILKELVFNVCLVLMALAILYLTGITNLKAFTTLTVIGFTLLFEAIFVMYDFAITRILKFYLVKLSPRLKFNK